MTDDLQTLDRDPEGEDGPRAGGPLDRDETPGDPVVVGATMHSDQAILPGMAAVDTDRADTDKMGEGDER